MSKQATETLAWRAVVKEQAEQLQDVLESVPAHLRPEVLADVAALIESVGTRPERQQRRALYNRPERRK
jgi:hypothetical protein